METKYLVDELIYGLHDFQYTLAFSTCTRVFEEKSDHENFLPNYIPTRRFLCGGQLTEAVRYSG